MPFPLFAAALHSMWWAENNSIPEQSTVCTSFLHSYIVKQLQTAYPPLVECHTVAKCIPEPTVFHWCTGRSADKSCDKETDKDKLNSGLAKWMLRNASSTLVHSMFNFSGCICFANDQDKTFEFGNWIEMWLWSTICLFLLLNKRDEDGKLNFKRKSQFQEWQSKGMLMNATSVLVIVQNCWSAFSH